MHYEKRWNMENVLYNFAMRTARKAALKISTAKKASRNFMEATKFNNNNI